MTGLLLMASTTWASPPSSELLARLDRLQNPHRVLYVAAHPDDENTRLIAWLVGQGFDVTYLSLTRGGGGQNLVGGEQSELLGVLRTGELLAARGVDGGRQRFTRARDFGYSKSPEESLAIWGEDEVLRDVVQAVRQVQPTVLVTRFGPDDQSHGHHVASAQLAARAISLAADADYVIEGTSPWTVQRAYRNESHWRIDDDTDTSGWHRVDVGTYEPRTGRSWGEVAADARTMHKSQGFGSAPSVGPQLEYLSVLKGIPEATAQRIPPVDADPFGGLDDWSDLPGGAKVAKAVAKAKKRFEPSDPAASLRDVAAIHEALASVEGPAARHARDTVERWLLDAVGLWVTARAEAGEVRPGEAVEVELTALTRSGPAVLRDVALVRRDGDGKAVAGQIVKAALAPHEPYTVTKSVVAPTTPTRPHWLEEAPSYARYTVPEGPLRTAAEGPPPLAASLTVEIGGVPVRVERPVTHAWTDRVHGERVEVVSVVPPITVTPARSARLVPVGSTADLSVSVRAHGKGPVVSTVRFVAPEGLQVEPSEVELTLEGGSARDVMLRLTPTGAQRPPEPLRAEVTVAGETAPAWRVDVIDHPHLDRRSVLRPAEVRVVPVDLQRGGVDTVAYVQGSGDAVDQALTDLGYDVRLLDPDALRHALGTGTLDADALVFGIRAFNTHPELLDLLPAVEDWVAEGRTALVQYNTSSRWTVLPPIGPGKVEIGRDRVTDERATMTLVDPEESVARFPNRLGEADLVDWVQERGLYFATSYADNARGVYTLNDAGEQPSTGALVVTPHGDGAFVYGGLSWFRQLPAGVPGAARLLANVLAAHEEPE